MSMPEKCLQICVIFFSKELNYIPSNTSQELKFKSFLLSTEMKSSAIELGEAKGHTTIVCCLRVFEKEPWI